MFAANVKRKNVMQAPTSVTFEIVTFEYFLNRTVLARDVMSAIIAMNEKKYPTYASFPIF